LDGSQYGGGLTSHYLDQREALNDEIFEYKNKPEGTSLGFIAAKPHGQSMQSKIITITPADATKFLENMVNNRPPASRHVTFLANAMRRGEWTVTGQPIIFSGPNTKSKLIDGQHRLLAVVASGVTIQSLAVFDAGENTYTKLDQGRGRSASDCLMVANRKPVANALRCIFSEITAEKGSLICVSNHKPTNEQVTKLLGDYQGIVDSASFISGLMRARKLIGHGAASYCLFRMRMDNAEQADKFMQKIHTGEGLSARSPILSLRNQLQDGVKRDGIASRWNSEFIIAGVALAWYMTLDGKHGAAFIPRAHEQWNGWRTAL
jgi:hypothetical protein